MGNPPPPDLHAPNGVAQCGPLNEWPVFMHIDDRLSLNEATQASGVLNPKESGLHWAFVVSEVDPLSGTTTRIGNYFSTMKSFGSVEWELTGTYET